MGWKPNPLTARKLKRFRSIRRGYWSFLMLSVALFEHVEQMNYQAANRLALTMMAIALATVLLSQWSGRRHDRF